MKLDLIVGCTDTDTACNYDANATDDGTCEYAEDYYDCDSNCISDIDSDGVCDELEIVGCTDSTACNYDANATDDGTCELCKIIMIVMVIVFQIQIVMEYVMS